MTRLNLRKKPFAIGTKTLPTYIVYAHKIQHIRDMGDGTIVITPVHRGYDRFRLDAKFIKKHEPKTGGYIVMRSDGSFAYADASVFEEPVPTSCSELIDD